MAVESVKTEGLKELQDMLDELPNQVSKQALAEGLKAGGRVIRDHARAIAPVGKGRKEYGVKNPAHKPGLLRKSIKSQMLPRKSKLTLGIKIGVFKKKKAKTFARNEAFYAYWVEKGTYGKPGARYMQRAAETKGVDSINAFRKTAFNSIGKLLAKYKFK